MINHLTKCALSVVLVFILFLQGCTPAGAPLATPAWVKLKVAALPYLSYAPLFIAQDEGYFAEQELEVEFVKLESEQAVPPLVQGQLDVLGGTITASLLNTMARGAGIKFVADRGYLAADSCTYSGWVARKELVEEGELGSPAQLRGRRVAFEMEELASMNGYRMGKLLEMGHLTLNDIELMDVSLPAALEAFEKGTIDLAAAGEPWLTRFVNTGHAVLWMGAEEIIPDFQANVIAYGPNLLKDNPDAGRRFMVAYLKAVRQYNDEGKTERHLEILAKYTKLDPEVLAQACWPSFRDDGTIDVQDVLEFEAWAIDNDCLDSTATEEQFWDPSFVEYANQVLISAGQ